MKTLISGAAVLCLAAPIVLLMPAREAQAQVRPWLCKYHRDAAIGHGRSRAEGLRAARRNWVSQVLWHDGPRYSDYARACDKREDCNISRHAFQRCYASARPGRRP